MSFFNLFSKNTSPSKIGKLYGDVVRDTLAEMFEKQNLLKLQKRFLNKGWEFNYPRYSFETMNIFANMVFHSIVREFSEHSGNKKIIKEFIDSLPDDFKNKDDFSKSMANMMFSKQPLMTLSRVSAENYFGKNPSPEQIMEFGSSAKAFQDVLDSFVREVKNK